MEIVWSKTPLEAAGHKLSEVLKINTTRPVLLMLSGGSSFDILQAVSGSVLGPNITLSVLDERFSTDIKVNNFLQLSQTDFFKLAVSNGVNYIVTSVSNGESTSLLKKRWESALKEWKNFNKEGIVVVTMGIGNDGHTAGIFAGEFEVDFDGSEWVVSYSIPKTINEYTERITVTKTFLRTLVDEAIVYAVGERKREIIKNFLIKSDCEKQAIPACVIKDLKEGTVFSEEV